jgi:hypothetical protein
MAGYEYSFPADPELGWLKDLWLVAEYFHNGIGETDPARHDKTILLSGREVTLGRDYAGVGLKKELHPLVEAQVYHIANLGDRSYYFGPSVSWNAVSELHLSAGWQMFGGGRLSEYGALPNSAYLQAQYFF